MLEVSPPAGILVGFEEDDEEDEFNDYARRAGSKLVSLADKHKLWVDSRRDDVKSVAR